MTQPLEIPTGFRLAAARAFNERPPHEMTAAALFIATAPELVEGFVETVHLFDNRDAYAIVYVAGLVVEMTIPQARAVRRGDRIMWLVHELRIEGRAPGPWRRRVR